MIKKLFEKKEHPHGGAFILNNPFSHIRKTDKRALVEEGYMHNAVVYRAINEIVKGIADIRIEVKRNGEIVKEHEAVKLLNRPNETQGGDSFLKQLFTDYLITGEMFCVKYPLGKKPIELWPLNPLNMAVEQGSKGVAQGYVHKIGNKKMTFSREDCFMMKSYNPLDYWRGMSPLEAASLAGDTHNEGMRWNYSLLRNGARPSGIIEFEGSPSEQTVSKLTEFFKKRFQGGYNAGEIPMLSEGAKWTATDNSPRDMDYISTMKETAKYIAAVYGVPLPLIDNDASSFNNMEQAKERLWTDTILPLFNEWLNQFGNWLMPMYGEGLELCADLDDIPALEGVRTRTFERMVRAVEAGLLSRDEAREAIGYDPKGGASDMLFVSANQIPLDMAESIPADESRMLDYIFETKALSESERTPPKGAKENAQKVLDWRQEHGDEVEGMTEVGWRRARQLADGGALSEDVIKRMAQFNRHRENGKLDDDKKGKPWTDAGYVAWLGWGGTSGIDWAIRQSEKMQEE